MPRTILIVDDLATNRRILHGMLCGDYVILEASDGEEALRILAFEQTAISAVLLDISMPGMNGYDVLQSVRSNAALAATPIIMITSSEDEAARVKSLTLGANDFVMKPYNSAVIKHCLKNNIAFHEAAATVNALQRDKLTGLYNREAFFERVREMVSGQAPGYYIMACFDIDKFKVINDQYGTQKGDEVLRHTAEVFKAGFAPQGGVCCRVSADNFAVLYPASFRDSAEINAIRSEACHVEGIVTPIIFSIGRYVVDDVGLSPAAMYDRAMLAAASIKGRFDTQIALYDETMRQRLLREQEIVLEMSDALAEKRFEVWFQPQYNHATDAMIGAEALVRWRHPRKGVIPPADFIPVFEQNGFIYALDKFVWEEVCRYLRKWLDEGRSPLPVSVNVSRYDVLRPDVVSTLCGLVERYRLPIELLRLEITESAFSESSKHIVDIVRALVGYGFTVEIDDFGSGYSSLNTLKDVPAQIIKLDMDFFASSSDSERGGNIVESVVRMAKWLNMSVIAEGVETLAQANYLRSIGCNYMQGYLYARPMPVNAYEVHCGGCEKEERLLALETVENLDNNAFWDPESMDTLIFNSFVGGACIYEYHNGNIELIRATEKYAQVIGSAGMTVEDALRLNWAEHLGGEDSKQVVADLAESIATRSEVTGEYVFLDLPGCPHKTYLRSTMRVIASAGDRYLVYCTNENITGKIEAEQKALLLSEQLQAIMDNVDLGIIAAIVEGDTARYLFANDRYYQMLGYTKEQFASEITSPYMTVAPEDRARIMEETARISATGESVLLVYHVLTRDGRKRVLQAAISIGGFTGIDEPVQFTILRDVTEEMEVARRERLGAEQMQNMMRDMPGGFVRMRLAEDGRLALVYFNEGMLKLTGMHNDELTALYGDDALAGVHPDDVGMVKDVIAKMFENGEAHSSRYRQLRGDGSYIWLSFFGRVTKNASGETFLSVYYTDASEQAKEEETQKALLDNLPGGAGIYTFENGQMRLTYQNKSYWELVGLNEEAYPDSAPMSAIHPDDIPLIMRELSSAVEQNRDVVCDIRLRHLTMGYRSVRLVGRIVHKDAGKFLVYATFTPNDAENMSYQQLLPQLLSAMMASTTDLSFVKDSKLRYITASHAFAHMVGQNSIDDVAGKTDYDLFEPSLADKFRQDDEELLASDESIIDMVERIPSEDGAPRYSSTSKYILRDGAGDVIGLYGCGRDVTKAIAQEAELLRANAILRDFADQRELIERLRISEEENILAVRLGGNVICRYVIADRTLTLAPDVAAAFSLPERISGVPYEPVRLGMIAPESADAYIGFFEAILHGSRAATAIFLQKYFGSWRWMEAKSSTVFADDGTPVKAVISFYDVTERLERETIYKKWQQSLAERNPASFTLFRCNLNSNTSYDTKEGALLTFDFDSAGQAFNDRTRAYAKQCVYESERDAYVAFVNADAMLASYYRGKRSGVMEYREIVPEGGARWIRLTVDLVEYPNSTEVEAYLMYEDIDAAKRAELATKALSETDPLTGLLNRTTFTARVERRIAGARPESRHALLMLDIDGFKQVNDVFGHGAGDQTLVDIANGLRAAIRRGDLVARFGGDEFLLFLNDVSDDAAIDATANRILALARKFLGEKVWISGSVGIAVTPRDGVRFDTLYHKADAALYYAKGAGKDRYTYYNEDVEKASSVDDAVDRY